jgi:hypothetical protein
MGILYYPKSLKEILVNLDLHINYIFLSSNLTHFASNFILEYSFVFNSLFYSIHTVSKNLNLGWDESVAEDNKFANTDSVRLENERDRGKN